MNKRIKKKRAKLLRSCFTYRENRKLIRWFKKQYKQIKDPEGVLRETLPDNDFYKS